MSYGGTTGRSVPPSLHSPKCKVWSFPHEWVTSHLFRSHVGSGDTETSNSSLEHIFGPCFGLSPERWSCLHLWVFSPNLQIQVRIQRNLFSRSRPRPHPPKSQKREKQHSSIIWFIQLLFSQKSPLSSVLLFLSLFFKIVSYGSFIWITFMIIA